MLTVLSLLIRRKNPVIADFTESITKQTGFVKIVLHSYFCRYTLYGKLPGKHFVLYELGVIVVLVNTISDT